MDLAHGAVELNIAAADLNRDGHTDLVAPNWYFPGGQFVTVLLGDGAGHFSMRTDLQAGAEPVKVALADLNNDRLLDIAAINVNSDDVVAYLAEGPARFGAGSFYAVGDGSEGLDVADLDGDGSMDLAVANVSSDTLSILFGDGTGQFGPSITLPAGPSSTSVAAGDLNGDRLLDRAVANLRPLPEGGVRVLLAERPGIFSGVPLQVASAPVRYSLPWNLRFQDRQVLLDVRLAFSIGSRFQRSLGRNRLGRRMVRAGPENSRSHSFTCIATSAWSRGSGGRSGGDGLESPGRCPLRKMRGAQPATPQSLRRPASLRTRIA